VQEHAHEHGVLENIGKIAGVEGVAVIHGAIIPKLSRILIQKRNRMFKPASKFALNLNAD
jgi:hypothetical protein